MAMRQGGRGDHTTSTAVLAVAVAALFLAGAPCTAQASASAGIEEACRGAAERDAAAVDYAHCVASLSSEREGRDTADMHALAAAATRMAVEYATATEERMEGLGEAHGRARSRSQPWRPRCEDAWKGEEDAQGGGTGAVPVAGHDKEYGRLAVVALGLISSIA
ncbi:hypothetical protein ZWY2020_047613 [Hordeum vulgare]|nr:hypothetical protein ZWY2020_047613 [Hordeum vulgare]